VTFLTSSIEIGLVMGLVLSWTVLSLAVSFRLLKFPDIGLEGSFLIGAAMYGMLLRSGWTVGATFVALICGALVGSTTAFLHVRLRINKFLAGIIVVAICYAVSLHILGAPNVSLLELLAGNDSLAQFDHGNVNWRRLFPLLAYPILGIPILVTWFHTRPGLRLRVVCANTVFARSLGLRTLWWTVGGLALSNALAAVSGILLVRQQGFIDIGMGAGVLLTSLAGLAIGEALTPRVIPFVPHVLISAVIGSIVYQVIQTLAVHAGLPAADLKLVTALLVIAMIVPRTIRANSPEEGVLT